MSQNSELTLFRGSLYGGDDVWMTLAQVRCTHHTDEVKDLFPIDILFELKGVSATMKINAIKQESAETNLESRAFPTFDEYWKREDTTS